MELNRTAEDYVKLLTDWMAVPTLDFFERSLIGEMLNGAKVGLDAFDEKRRFIHANFNGQLWVAITKARAHGVGQNWKQYA